MWYNFNRRVGGIRHVEYLDIKSRIERISREINELKKMLILEGVIDKEKTMLSGKIY